MSARLEITDESTCPEILRRILALGRPDYQVEKEAGITSYFLNKARRGSVKEDHANWPRLLAYLDGAPVTPRASLPEEGESAEDREARVLQELALEAEDADSLEKVDDLLKSVTGSLARKDVSAAMARAMREIVTERRQTLIAIAEARARLDGSRPLTIEVVHVNNWMAKVLANRERQDELD